MGINMLMAYFRLQLDIILYNFSCELGQVMSKQVILSNGQTMSNFT